MQRYKDFYGATATIKKTYDGYKLVVSVMGRKVISKTYNTERGAKIAMGRVGDAWRQI